jgi:hypothetical protein
MRNYMRLAPLVIVSALAVNVVYLISKSKPPQDFILRTPLTACYTPKFAENVTQAPPETCEEYTPPRKIEVVQLGIEYSKISIEGQNPEQFFFVATPSLIEAKTAAQEYRKYSGYFSPIPRQLKDFMTYDSESEYSFQYRLTRIMVAYAAPNWEAAYEALPVGARLIVIDDSKDWIELYSVEDQKTYFVPTMESW